MTRLINFWKSSPLVRALARAVAVAVIAYVVDVYRGENEWLGWMPFATGLGSAIIFALIGALGLEPFLGIKPKNVIVPSNADVKP
jgi:hypothetical protein